MASGRLTVAKVRAAACPRSSDGKPAHRLIGDGGGLYLNVTSTGGKQWVQRITIAGRRRTIGLGGWPTVSLDAAREQAIDNRRAVRAGRDPVEERRKAAMPTFREAAEATIAANEAKWRNAKTATNWRFTLGRYAFPAFGDVPVGDVRNADVLRVLTPIWTAKPSAARKLRQRIRSTLSWAQAHGYAEHNAAGEGIDGALPAMPAVKRHHRALPYAEIPGALDTIEASDAGVASKACLRFVVLTAARSGEGRGATWAEIDAERREWRIPAERMKAAAEHRVPLSDAALETLERARPLRDASGLIFPSPSRPGRPLSDMTLTKVLRSTGLAERATVHGFRSGFRDWCADTGKPREIAEAALAHTVGGVEGAYFRSDLFERRRLVMDAWGQFCTRTPARVVEIRRHG